MTDLPAALLEDSLDEIGQAIESALIGGRDAVYARLSEAASAPGNADIRNVFEALRGKLSGEWSRGCNAFGDRFRERVRDESGTVGLASSVNELQLMDDDVVEWDIAVSASLARIAASAGEDLSDLEQRLAMLAGDAYEERGGDHGLVASAVGAGLRQMIETIADTLTERRTLLPHLLAVLAESLKSSVASTNAALAERGLNPAAARREAARSKSAKRREENVLSALERIAGPAPAGSGAGTGGGAGGGGGGLPGGLVALPVHLVESLNRLQDIDHRLLAGAADVAEPVGGSALRAFRQAEAHRLPPMEATMIDLVATIFDLVFQDGQVPDAIKALIGRLQIPLLKVAMVDRSFFSSREHPARAFLDAISKGSVSLGKEIDRDHPYCAKAKQLINRILDEFESNQKIFAELMPDLRDLIAATEAAADQLAERTRAVAEQQEASELAEIKAEEVFERIIKEGLDADLPQVASDFLGTHWPKVLKAAYLSGGQGGAQWTVALQTLTDLIWSLKPKDDAELRAQLIKRLPGLLKRIGACLDRAEVSAEDRQPFMDCLMASHSALIKGAQKKSGNQGEDGGEPRRQAKPSKPKESAPVKVVTRTVAENGVEVESVSVDGKVKARRPIRSSEIGDVRIGDWVEFMRRGVWLRVRLSWVSPARGVMMFTNPDNHKALSVTPEALALQLKSGDARVLEDAPLVDRVLDKAIESMQGARV